MCHRLHLQHGAVRTGDDDNEDDDDTCIILFPYVTVIPKCQVITKTSKH